MRVKRCHWTGRLRSLTHRLAFVVTALLAAAPLLAQNAELSGSITDPSGLAVPGARVVVRSADTGGARTVSSNQQGEYSVGALLPGPYSITIGANGFKTVNQSGVVVEVDQRARLDFALTVGSTTETVTVQGSAPLLNASDASVSTVIDPHFVDNIPLNGRSFQTLIMLTPGVVVTPTTFDDQGQFSVNGQRPDANYFMVDGVSANFGVTGYTPLVQAAGGALPALSVSGGTNSLVSIDAMQEFRVQTSSFAPEFGRTAGGQISIATRSGTNDFHGTAFDYFRNDVLDGRDWFVNYNDLSKPEERQNDFGGVLGGPIFKDKTFFFFSYEGLRLRQPAAQETAVPDNPARQQAPAAIQPFLNAYPAQNGPEIGSGLAQFNASYSDPLSLEATSIRIDQAIGSKVNLFGRYNYSPSDLTQRGPFLSTARVLSLRESVSSTVQTGTLGLNQVITPRISNELRGNYSNDRVGTKYALDNFGGAVPLPDSLVFPPGYSSRNGLFQFILMGAGTYYQGKQATDEQRQVNIIDNVSVVENSHHLKFGIDYRWLSAFSSPYAYSQLSEFLGVECSSPPCPGYAQSGTSAVSAIFAYQSDTLISKNLSLYGQDSWRATPRLTVTYGLRWDLNPPLKGSDLTNQPFTVTGLNDPATIALAPRGTSLYQTTYHNVAPRVGVAYQMTDKPNWRSVLRGGFGIFYDLGYGSLGGASYSFPFEALKVIPAASLPLSPTNATPPQLTASVPVSGTMVVAEPQLKIPRTYEWNATLEQSLGKSQILSLTYVGAAGRDLLRVTPLINPNPNFPFLDVISNTATSNYQALQVKLERKLLKGLQALVSYTWSHSIDDASTDAFATYLNTPSFIANPSIDRGSSDFDIRHAFTSGLTYSLPKPGWNQLARIVLGGWSVDSFVFARSAPPVDVVSGLVFANGVDLYPRPNLNPGVPLVLYGSGYPGGKIFNSAAFVAPPTGEQGDLGRNVLRGFGAWQADVAIQRQFALTEKVGLRLRGEFFNIFNHPNFGSPDNVLTDALFGRSTQTLANSLGSGGANGGFNPLYQIGGPRSIQLALKLVF
jgi:hypothetical protein